MGFRTNPDRILENIDRDRSRREQEPSGFERQASGRELDTDVPDRDATNPERIKRVFRAVERAYVKTAQRDELGKLASRFQAIGDLHHHHGRGDVSVQVRYLDASRREDVGMAPFEITPDEVQEARKQSATSRADVNALRVLRQKLRAGVMSAYDKIEPRIRDAVRERADLGHVEIQVTVDLRPVR